MGIRDRPTSLRSPWQNGYVERLIGSVRRECDTLESSFQKRQAERLGSLEVGDEIELGWRLLLANQLVLHMHDDITLLICP
jgi:hypothetical protein